MRINPIAAIALCAAFTAGEASAHPGPKLLTVDSKTPRAATTQTMSFTQEKGVHVFRATPTIKPAAQATSRAAPAAMNLIVEKRYRPRSIRNLRTQGFYSGKGPASRRFTQGFYSGQ